MSNQTDNQVINLADEKDRERDREGPVEIIFSPFYNAEIVYDNRVYKVDLHTVTKYSVHLFTAFNLLRNDKAEMRVEEDYIDPEPLLNLMYGRIGDYKLVPEETWIDWMKLARKWQIDPANKMFLDFFYEITITEKSLNNLQDTPMAFFKPTRQSIIRNIIVNNLSPEKKKAIPISQNVYICYLRKAIENLLRYIKNPPTIEVNYESKPVTFETYLQNHLE